jgi:acetyl-CoA synthetase
MPMANGNAGTIEALVQEQRRNPPPSAFAAQANVNDPAIYQRANEDAEVIWAEPATNLSWFQPHDPVLEWNPPCAKWLVGGEIKACYNCVDHLLPDIAEGRVVSDTATPTDPTVLSDIKRQYEETDA